MPLPAPHLRLVQAAVKMANALAMTNLEALRHKINAAKIISLHSGP